MLKPRPGNGAAGEATQMRVDRDRWQREQDFFAEVERPLSAGNENPESLFGAVRGRQRQEGNGRGDTVRLLTRGILRGV